MNCPPPARSPFRRALRWMWVGAGLCLAPFVILAIIAISYLRLDRDAAVLRQQVMAATDTDWSTKIQMNLGPATLNAANFGLRFIDYRKVADARLALGAIKRASVGVYERSSVLTAWSGEIFLVDTDRAMRKRGWLRLVGVVDKKDAVLIYVPQDMNADDSVEVCLAVVNERELVVASTRVNGPMLSELIKQHTSHAAVERLLHSVEPFHS